MYFDLLNPLIILALMLENYIGLLYWKIKQLWGIKRYKMPILALEEELLNQLRQQKAPCNILLFEAKYVLVNYTNFSTA